MECKAHKGIKPQQPGGCEDLRLCRATRQSALQTPRHKKRVSLIHRTATTSCPCCLPALGKFKGSWSCMTYPSQRYTFSAKRQKSLLLFVQTVKNERQHRLYILKLPDALTAHEDDRDVVPSFGLVLRHHLTAVTARRRRSGTKNTVLRSRYGNRLHRLVRKLGTRVEHCRSLRTKSGRIGRILLIRTCKNPTSGHPHRSTDIEVGIRCIRPADSLYCSLGKSPVLRRQLADGSEFGILYCQFFLCHKNYVNLPKRDTNIGFSFE